MSRRSAVLLAAGVVLALGASACTNDDAEQAVDELPVEVEGEVLDRRDATDEPDEDDGDLADGEDADADADVEDVDAADGGDDLVDDQADADTAAPAAPAAPRSRAGDASSGDASSGAPAERSAPSPARTPRATPAPAPTSEPTPVATPEPRTVADGPARSTGPVLDSDGVDWIVTSSRTVERDEQPPAMTVGLLPGEDAPRRQVRCQAALEAPDDRGLVVRGTLTVSLRIELPDGTVNSLPRQRHELDVTLAPGRRMELAVSPPRELDVADVRQVTCVAELSS